MVQLMGGNPFAPIERGMRDIGQGYYQGQMAKMGMQQQKQEREDTESHRKVTYLMNLLNIAESSEDKRNLVKLIGQEMNGRLDALDLFRDIDDTAKFLPEQYKLYQSGRQTVEQLDKNIQMYVYTHPKSEVAKDALGYRRDIAKEQRKLKAATAKDIFGLLAKGEIVEVPKEGLITDLEDKSDMFEYPPDSGKWFKRITEPKELTFEEKERIKAKYKGPKEPTLVTWTTATKELKGRFGKQDPIGNIIITPELAGMHRIAQKKLVVLKRQGIKPLDAINKSEDFARNVESRYWQYMDAAPFVTDPITKKRKKLSSKERMEREKRIKEAFKSKYNYVPRRKPIR